MHSYNHNNILYCYSLSYHIVASSSSSSSDSFRARVPMSNHRLDVAPLRATASLEIHEKHASPSPEGGSEKGGSGEMTLQRID